MFGAIIKSLILVGLVGCMYVTLTRLDQYAASVVHPGENRKSVDPDRILDLQFGGYTCEGAVSKLSGFTSAQREGLKKVYTDLYDVYWPLSILATFVFLAYWATGRLFSKWILVPLLIFGVDMVENTLILQMITSFESQSAVGKTIDLKPTCTIVGTYVTPFKWALIPTQMVLFVVMIFANVIGQQKGADSKKKTH